MQAQPNFNSLPHLQTPPFSPRAPPPDVSTTQLLESLVSFYQQEMMWVHRTRASLELLEPSASSTESVEVPSSTHSTIVIEEDTAVKAEPTTTPPTSPTRWIRRKQNYKLRLDGISPTRTRRLPGEDRVSQSGVRILELFESMMEARMESCQRVNRLVRNANRSKLCVR